MSLWEGYTMNLAELIRAHKGEATWQQLEERCGGTPGAKRWQQYALQASQVNFPDVANMKAISQALGVTERSVMEASAHSAGLDVGEAGPPFVSAMTSLRGTELLQPEEVSAVAQIVRALVARAEVAGRNGG